MSSSTSYIFVLLILFTMMPVICEPATTLLEHGIFVFLFLLVPKTLQVLF
uniref:Uncharacterized protein n=1 Tax=Setaria viridis TaxID=4556 RepID=A0A4V6DCW9_SETVI|nr:hypothetical protein SEVIR_1G160932v2 [Setaria viridis]